MTREFQRATFHRSALVRILSDTQPQIPDTKYDFGERLGRWLNLSDAMTLFSVLGAEADARMLAQSSDNDQPEQLARLRQTLSAAIHHDGVFCSVPEGVITSYSIHYTKLYEPSSVTNIDLAMSIAIRCKPWDLSSTERSWCLCS